MNWQKFSNEKKFFRFSGKDAHPCFIPFLKRLSLFIKIFKKKRPYINVEKSVGLERHNWNGHIVS